MKSIFTLSAIGTFCILTTSTIAQTILYVEPNGSSSGDCISSPCTIERAKTRIRDLTDGNMTQNIEVHLTPETYYLSSTFTLNDVNDGGNNGYQVIYKKDPTKSGEVILSGGKKITGWSLHQNGIYKASIGTISDARQFYVNERRAIRARTPNLIENDPNFDLYNNFVSFETGTKTIRIYRQDISNWSGYNEIEMLTKQHWYSNVLPLSIYSYSSTPPMFFKEISSSVAEVAIKNPAKDRLFARDHAGLLEVGRAYHFENSLDFVDASGEWYLDRSAHMIYYKPRSDENISSEKAILPSLENILRIEGNTSTIIQNISFKEISFAHSTWLLPSVDGLVGTQGVQDANSPRNNPGAIQVKYANNIVFDNCTIKHTGCNGIVFEEGVKNSQIINNEIYDISANGILIDLLRLSTINNSSNSGKRCTDNIIANNKIHKYGQQYTNGIGIFGSHIENHVIEHNEIYDAPFMGMQFGNNYSTPTGKNNLIRYNEIHHVMQLHDDGGAIYTRGKQPDTRIYENYIHDLTPSPVPDVFYDISGIYIDDKSENIDVGNNVIAFTETEDRVQVKLQTIFGSEAKNNIIYGIMSSNTSIQNYAGIKPDYIPPVSLPYFSTGKIEAEDMNLINYNPELSGLASGGKFVKLQDVNKPGVAQYVYSGTNGFFDIKVGYGDESDGACTFKLYINSTLKGTLIANGYTGTDPWILASSRTFENIEVRKGDQVRVEGERNSGELARLDYVELLDRSLPTHGRGKLEAEDMSLTNYVKESNGSASGDYYIKASSTPANARYIHNGSDGKISVEVQYVDENDGSSTFQIFVNGTKRTEWQANQNTGSTSMIKKIRRVFDMSVNHGDEIKIVGKLQGGEFARLDYLSVLDWNMPYFEAGGIEAEDMNYTNYEFEAFKNSDANNFITATSTATGSAKFRYSGISNSFDVKIKYGDENDGASTFKLYINNNEIGSWIADQNTSSNWIEMRTKTFNDIRINQGDYVEIKGIPHSGELARLDSVELIPLLPVFGTGKFEAEDMYRMNYTPDPSGLASGGEFVEVVDINKPGYIRYIFNSPEESYTIKVGYGDENDGASTFELYINKTKKEPSWTASAHTASTPWIIQESKEFSNVTLKEGDEIKVKGVRNSGELARLDYVEITLPNNGRFSQADTKKLFPINELGDSIHFETGMPMLLVYPNPIEDQYSLNIQFENFDIQQECDISIMNGTGQVIYQDNLFVNNNILMIPLPNVPSGIYAVVVRQGNRRFVQKIIIQ